MHKVRVSHQEIDEDLFIRSEKLKINITQTYNNFPVFFKTFSRSFCLL